MESYNYTLGTYSQTTLAADEMYICPQVGDRVLIPISVDGTVHMAIGAVTGKGTSKVYFTPIQWAFSTSYASRVGHLYMSVSSKPNLLTEASAEFSMYEGYTTIPETWTESDVSDAFYYYDEAGVEHITEFLKYITKPYYWDSSQARYTCGVSYKMPSAVTEAFSDVSTLKFWPIYQNLRLLNYRNTNMLSILTPVAVHIANLADNYPYNLLLARVDTVFAPSALTVSTYTIDNPESEESEESLPFIDFNAAISTNSSTTFIVGYLTRIACACLVSADSPLLWKGGDILESI